MNYGALEGLVNSILSSFKCNNCETKSEKDNISVSGIEKNSIIINVTCSKCGKVSTIKSEIVSVDLNNLNLPKEQIDKLRKGIIKNNTGKIGKLKPKINNQTLTDLNKYLKKENVYVSDLFLDK